MFVNWELSPESAVFEHSLCPALVPGRKGSARRFLVCEVSGDSFTRKCTEKLLVLPDTCNIIVRKLKCLLIGHLLYITYEATYNV